jgi:hypothetical protein
MGLVFFPDCNPVERYNKWLESGGVLRGEKAIGCGINTLAFLDVLFRPDAEYLVGDLRAKRAAEKWTCRKVKGTPFKELIDYVYAWNEQNAPGTLRREAIHERVAPIGTQDELTLALNTIENKLPANSCTIVKFNMKADPEMGHTIVISKDESGTLMTIDPQQGGLRARPSACGVDLTKPCSFDAKFFEAYHRYFQSVSVMMYIEPEEGDGDVEMATEEEGGKRTRTRRRRRRKNRTLRRR